MTPTEFKIKAVDDCIEKFFWKDLTYWHVRDDVRVDDLLKFISSILTEFEKVINKNLGQDL